MDLEGLLGYMALFAPTIFCWLLVFNKRVRDGLPRPTSGVLLDYYENEQERIERDDTLIKGIATIFAVIFTLFSIFGLFAMVISIFQPDK